MTTRDDLDAAIARLRHDVEVTEQTSTEDTRWFDLHMADVVLVLDALDAANPGRRARTDLADDLTVERFRRRET